MSTDTLLVTSNATDLSSDGWLKIAPWGDHPNSVGLQRVQKEDGDAMVSAFNSLAGKAGRLFRGIPIFVGHPDRDPNRYPDKRRYGKVTALESRADGLYAKPAFNDLGQQVIEQGHYLYNSPVWALRREGGVVRPVELLSIGLTNEPNIKGEPWAKNEAEETGDRGQEAGDTAANGDAPGHPFRGNQHTGGAGAGSDAKAIASTEKTGREYAEHLSSRAQSMSDLAAITNDVYDHSQAKAAHDSAALAQHRWGTPERSQVHKAASEKHWAAVMQKIEGTNTAPLPAASESPSAASNGTPDPRPQTPNPPTPMTPEEKAQHEAALAAANAKIAELTTAVATNDAALKATQADLAAANAKAATERARCIELAANSIIAAGRRTTAQRAALVAELTAANDLDAAILAATNAKPALPTQSAVANLGERKAEGQGAVQVAINEAVLATAAAAKIDVHSAGGWDRAWLLTKTKNPALFGIGSAAA